PAIFSPMEQLEGRPSKRLTKASVKTKKAGEQVAVQFDSPQGKFFTNYEKQTDGSWKSLDPRGKDIDFPDDDALLKPVSGKSVREAVSAPEKPVETPPKAAKEVKPGGTVKVGADTYTKEDSGQWSGRKFSVPATDDE